MGLIEKLPVLRKDYANHAVYGEALSTAGVLIGLGLMYAVSYLTAIWWFPALAGLVLTAIFAYAKEKYSANTGRGEESINDFWYTMYGGTLISIVYLLGAMPK